jgi:tRNA threonylcarbamoyladenosine biosynthesis protein TsaB
MLLALDTSTQVLGVALYNGERVVYEAIWSSNNYHTVELAPTIAESLARAGCEADELQAVSVALGPGSFTSLRVGIAFAKGLALANRLPLIGIPTLDVVASAQPVQDIALVAVLHAGRRRLAAGWYHAISGAWHSTGEVTVMTPAELAGRIRKPTIICGELGEESRRLLRRKYKNARIASPAQTLRRPSYLAELAWKRLESGQVDDPNTLSPIYVHKNKEELA